MHIQTRARGWRSSDNVVELVVSYCVGFKDPTQVIRLSSKCLYLPYLLPGSSFCMLLRQVLAVWLQSNNEDILWVENGHV